MIRALRRRGTAALGLGLAAVLAAATGCGGDDDAAAARRGRQGHPDRQRVRQLRLRGPVQAVPGQPPERHDRRARHRLRPVQLHARADQEPGRRQRRRRRGRPRRGHHDPVQGAGAELRRPRRVRRQRRPQGNFLPWKFEGGPGRRTARSSSASAPTSAAWACATARDLFQKAGLPTDRDAVAKLWPTWDAYVDVGNKFKAKQHRGEVVRRARPTPTTRSWCRGRQVARLHLLRHGTTSWSSTPTRRSSRRTTRCSPMIGDGLSAGYKSFSDQWNAGFKQGTFATIACPAWMLGYIQGQAGDGQQGQVGRHRARPASGGNWGGSWLAVPKQSKHPKEAAELVRFLTSPKGQVAAFKAVNDLPSSPVALDDPATKAFKNAVLQQRPGRRDLRHRRQGAASRSTSDRATRRSGTRWRTRCCAVQQGKLKPEEAWAQAVEDAQQAAQSEAGGAGGEQQVAVGTTVPPDPRRTGSGRPGRSGPSSPGGADERGGRDAGATRRQASRSGAAARVRPGGRPDRPAASRTAAANAGGTRLSWADIKALAVPLHRAVLRAVRRSSASSRWSTPAWVSLHDWELASDEHPWIGLDNYSRLVDRPGVLERAVATRSASSCSPPCRSWPWRC